MFVQRDIMERGAKNLYVEALKTNLLPFDARSISKEPSEDVHIKSRRESGGNTSDEAGLSLRHVAAMVTRDAPVEEELSLRHVAAIVSRDVQEDQELSLRQVAAIVGRDTTQTANTTPMTIVDNSDWIVTAAEITAQAPTSSLVEAERIEQPQFSLDEQIAGDRPPPPPPPPKHNMPESTEHILIAAGSIGATVFIILFAYGFYLMRKKGMTISDILRYPSRRRHARDSQVTNPEDWRVKSTPRGNRSSRYLQPFRSSTFPPAAAPDTILRNPSTSSSRPLLKSAPFPASRISLDRRPSATSDLEKQEYIAALPRKPLPSYQTQGQNNSATLTANDVSQFSPTTPTAPLKSFRQFLATRNSVLPTPKVSRFSWATSAAQPTPRTATFGPQGQRDTMSTTRQSLPRFRTVQSWVNQQSANIGIASPRNTQDTYTASQYLSEPAPSVPNIPANYQSAPPPLRQSSLGGGAPQTAPRISMERSRARGHARRATNQSEASAFRHHPGDEVMVARGSIVPSEILDAKVGAVRL